MPLHWHQILFMMHALSLRRLTIILFEKKVIQGDIQVWFVGFVDQLADIFHQTTQLYSIPNVKIPTTTVIYTAVGTMGIGG